MTRRVEDVRPNLALSASWIWESVVWSTADVASSSMRILGLQTMARARQSSHQEQGRKLHEALGLAIEDIIERWWTDEEARFPQRMPLEPQEEDLLRVSLIDL